MVQRLSDGTSGRSAGVARRSGDSQVASILVLLAHSVILWVLIPVGFLAWLVCVPFTFPRPIGLGAFLGWLAFNEIVFLQRVPFRLWIKAPRSWLRPREMRGLRFRISMREIY